jgi:hypothetical protein
MLSEVVASAEGPVAAFIRAWVRCKIMGTINLPEIIIKIEKRNTDAFHSCGYSECAF